MGNLCIRNFVADHLFSSEKKNQSRARESSPSKYPLTRRKPISRKDQKINFTSFLTRQSMFKSKRVFPVHLQAVSTVAIFIATVSGFVLSDSPKALALTNVTSNFQVTATVTGTCTLATTTLAFGTYSPSGAALAGSTTISPTCTNSTPWTLSFNAGTTSGGTISQRLMANGSATLKYNLYTTAADTTVLGDGTSGSSTITGTGTGAAQATTIYGLIPTGQYVTAGSYADTITATISY
jgi:spore coat protein U-like protein